MYVMCFSGTRHKCLGGRRTHAMVPQVVYISQDGFIYYSARTTGVEPEDEQVIKYTVRNNNQYHLTYTRYIVGEIVQIDPSGFVT